MYTLKSLCKTVMDHAVLGISYLNPRSLVRPDNLIAMWTFSITSVHNEC